MCLFVVCVFCVCFVCFEGVLLCVLCAIALIVSELHIGVIYSSIYYIIMRRLCYAIKFDFNGKFPIIRGFLFFGIKLCQRYLIFVNEYSQKSKISFIFD